MKRLISIILLFITLTFFSFTQNESLNYNVVERDTMNVGINGETNLIWSKYRGLQISTYNIWRGAELDSLEIIGSVAGSNFTYSDENPLEETNIYIVEAVSQVSCNPNNLKSSYGSSFSNKVRSPRLISS